MIALIALFCVLGLFTGWALWDLCVALGLVEGQHTASMYIKRRVREKKWHKLLLALIIVTGAAYGAAYLLLHLIAQVI
jgi:hypothetical protein